MRIYAHTGPTELMQIFRVSVGSTFFCKTAEKNELDCLIFLQFCRIAVFLGKNLQNCKTAKLHKRIGNSLRVSFHAGAYPVRASVYLSVIPAWMGSRMYFFPGSLLSAPGHTSHSYKIQQRRRTCTHARQKKHEFGHQNGQTGKIKNRKPVHTHTRESREERLTEKRLLFL